MERWTFQGSITSNKFQVVLPSSTPAGTTAYVTAFWFNSRQQSGTAATPVQFTVQGGGVQSVGT